jgi:LemA protein
MTGFIVAGAVVLLPVIWAIATHNRFVSLRQQIRESWADVDVELKRRYDLIPQLVNVVKGYAGFERDTLEQVTALRNRAAANHGPQSSQATDEIALARGLKQLFVVAENYPDLKANRQYLALQKELANTEDRIAAARRFYNGNVRDLNVLRVSFPASLMAGGAGVTADQSYFELDSAAERVVPRVEL